MLEQNKKITPQERAALFAKRTRQNQRMVFTRNAVAGDIVSFDIPKTRLLGQLKVEISCVVNSTQAAAADYAPHEDAPYNFLRRAELNLNNGFSPFSVSGQTLAAYNRTLYRGAPGLLTRVGATALGGAAPVRSMCEQSLLSAAGGANNVVNFTLEMPAFINRRDPVGLLLLQNDETLATVNITLGQLADLCPAAGGYAYAFTGGIVVRLISESFNVPSMEEARPDISVLKLVQERTIAIVAGENTIQLPIGVTYRKLGFIVYTAAPIRIADAGITGNIDILFNQSDNPYSLTPKQLSIENAEAFGGFTPHGEFCFDWSYQGLTNIGGSRDYIDTNELTEFWLRFTAAAPGTCRVWSETLSQLK